MRILLDTCIWSSIFRYKNPVQQHIDYFESLVLEDRAVIIGPIRQEVLSGIKDSSKHASFKESLRAFPDLPMNTEIFEVAAEIFTTCRSHGISASSVDMMICAASRYYRVGIWTTDLDFLRYSQCVDLQVHTLPSS